MDDRRHQFPGALVARFVTLPTMARFEGDLPESRPATAVGELTKRKVGSNFVALNSVGPLTPPRRQISLPSRPTVRV